MKKICSVMCLALISIFFVVYANAQNSNPATIDLANIPQNIEGIGSLTLVLEESLKPSSLSEEWMQGRAAWRESVKTSREIVDMRNLIYKLELNLQYISQSEEWRNFRAEWLGKIKAVSEIKELAKLLVQLEQNLRWTAQNDTWRQQRENWIKAANKISGDTQIPGKIEDQDHLLSSAVKKNGKSYSGT